MLALASRLGAAEPRLIWRALWDDGKSALQAPHWGLAALAGGAVATLALSDTTVYHSVRGGNAFLDQAMPLARELGGAYAPLLPAALWAVGGDDLSAASASALETLGLVAVVSAALKPAFSANRPNFDDQKHAFFDYSGRYSVLNASFPSGHTMTAFGLAEVYGSRYGRWWTYPLAAVTGYSRIYEAAHWPSDVLFGALLGAGLGHVVARAREEKGPPTRLFSLAPLPGGGVIALSQLRF